MVDVYSYWKAVLCQDADGIRAYFHESALVRWHNTNECFTVGEFIRANCDYPGDWGGEVERLEVMGDLAVTVTHVYSADKSLSFHVVSFIRFDKERIVSIDEYWGDDGQAPQWRIDMNIGSPIV